MRGWFKWSYHIATVWGIPIQLDISLVIVFLIFIHDFGFLLGIVLELGLLSSIIMHELGHSAVAISKGCRVRRIRLSCIGGAAEMESLPSRPIEEFMMAIAGPFVSIVFGVLLTLAMLYIPFISYSPFIYTAFYLLALINFVLAGFNLLPAFPMDGGRVLRSLLSLKMGRLRATYIAARLGRIMAVLFGIYGIFNKNIFLIFIAFFIFVSAGNEYRLVQMQETLKSDWFDFIGFSPPTERTDDTVEISAPPYRRGKTKTDIYRENC